MDKKHLSEELHDPRGGILDAQGMHSKQVYQSQTRMK